MSSLSEVLYVQRESEKSTLVSSKDIIYMTDSDAESGILEHELVPVIE